MDASPSTTPRRTTGGKTVWAAPSLQGSMDLSQEKVEHIPSTPPHPSTGGKTVWTTSSSLVEDDSPAPSQSQSTLVNSDNVLHLYSPSKLPPNPHSELSGKTILLHSTQASQMETDEEIEHPEVGDAESTNTDELKYNPLERQSGWKIGHLQRSTDDMQVEDELRLDSDTEDLDTSGEFDIELTDDEGNEPPRKKRKCGEWPDIRVRRSTLPLQWSIELRPGRTSFCTLADGASARRRRIVRLE